MRFVHIIAATLFFASPALAQTPAPDAAAPSAAPGAGPAEPAAGGGGGKAKVKEIMAGCRADAKAQGLKGQAMQQAAMDCAVKQRPALAGRMQCRKDGMAKGLTKDDLKSFVKDCLKSKS